MNIAGTGAVGALLGQLCGNTPQPQLVRSAGLAQGYSDYNTEERKALMAQYEFSRRRRMLWSDIAPTPGQLVNDRYEQVARVVTEEDLGI